MVLILDKIVDDHPNVTKLVLWSDSCVPQNRNSIMSVAIQSFMRNYPQIVAIQQKCCEPGHSEIQEIDCVHSQIEKATENCEIYSPVGLVRILASVPRKNPIRLIQMRSADVFDFQNLAKKHKYQSIPYSKVKTIEYMSVRPAVIRYKTSLNGNWSEESIDARNVTRNGAQSCFRLGNPTLLTMKHGLAKDKIADIKSMLPFMPEQDKLYMQNVCKIVK
jgi:hypothetical protein